MVYKASSHPQYDSNVVNIQRNLNDLRPKAEEFFMMSLWGHLATDGKYGLKTAEAVKAFQKAFNCSPYDGIYGPATDAALHNAFTQLRIIENAKPVATSINQSSSPKHTQAPICSASSNTSQSIESNEIPSCSINYTPANPTCHQDSFMCSTLCTSNTESQQPPTISTDNVKESFSEKLTEAIKKIAKAIYDSLANFSTVGSIIDELRSKIRDIAASATALKESIAQKFKNNIKWIEDFLTKVKNSLKSSLNRLKSKATSLSKAVKGKGGGAAGAIGFIIDTFLSVKKVFMLAFGEHDHPVSDAEIQQASYAAIEEIVLGLVSVLVGMGLVALVSATGGIAILIGILVSVIIGLIILLVRTLFGLKEGDIVKEVATACQNMINFCHEAYMNSVKKVVDEATSGKTGTDLFLSIGAADRRLNRF